jgi:uncharacterized damage-inducible protein DinB
MKSRQNDHFLELLDRSFDRISWHGPNLANSFRGLDAKAAARPIHGRKSIWQQVLHAAYWKQRVLNKLAGTQRFARAGTNWPKVPKEITRQAWKADVQLLYEIHARLRSAVAARDPRTITPKLRMMIYGVAMHDVYHAGQIRMLRKMLRTKGSK